MPTQDGFGGDARLGDWNVICDHSGFKCKASETVKIWDGMRVLRRFAEERQPQDLIKGVKDNQNVPWSRPETTDVFITVPVRPEDL